MSTVYLNSNHQLGIGTTSTATYISPSVFTPTFSIPEGTITFGTHTFTADQLGHLLSILLAQHPEVAL